MASLSRTLRPAARRQLLVPFARRAFSSARSPIYSESQVDRELEVGELQGAKFKIEPLRRVGEDEETMRARLLYQSRKRGTLESDLLMSTFAKANLPTMSKSQMQQYDLFLDENDWDIYYWATQDESPGPDTTPTSHSPSESNLSSSGTASASNQSAGKTLHDSHIRGAESYRGVSPGADKTIDAGHHDEAPTAAQIQAAKERGKTLEDVPVREKKEGEWAQTVGTFKPAYRPVPARWKGSEILQSLRAHVESRRADGEVGSGRQGAGQGAGQGGEKGMGFMPPL